MSRKDNIKHNEELQRLRELLEDAPREKLVLGPAWWLAVCIGTVVAIIPYLQDKTPLMVVFCLLVLAVCLGFVLFCWCNQWHWIAKSSPGGRLIKLVFIGTVECALVAAYGTHVWPKPTPASAGITKEELRTELNALLGPLGDNISRQKLLARYPLGYVIFDVDYRNSVFPYESQAALDRFDFDWSVVRFTQNTSDRITLRYPDVRLKDGTPMMSHILFQGPRRVGKLEAGTTFGHVFMRGEILAFRDNGVVFLVGFEPWPPNLPGTD